MQPITVLYLAAINWLVTTIFVESTLFAPARDLVVRKSQRVRYLGKLYKLPFTFPEGTTPEDAQSAEIGFAGPWQKVAQLVTCHMCLGTWVGFALAAFFGGPLALRWGILTVIANGLLYKAGGHFILELRSRLAKVDTPAAPSTQEVTTSDVPPPEHRQSS